MGPDRGRGRERRDVRGHVIGKRRGALAATARTAAARRARSRPARRGCEPGGVAASPHGARLGLERCERDQRLAEAALHVREAEIVIERQQVPGRGGDSSAERVASRLSVSSSASRSSADAAPEPLPLPPQHPHPRGQRPVQARARDGPGAAAVHDRRRHGGPGAGRARRRAALPRPPARGLAAAGSQQRADGRAWCC